MTQQLDLVIAAKNATDAAFLKMDASLRSTQQQVGSTTTNFGKFADGVGKVSTTLARSADAFGLPIGALRTLDDVADVAEIGLNNLSQSAVGFNTASLGAAGAGAAIGAAIGSMILKIDGAAEAYTNLARSMLESLGVVDRYTGAQFKQTDMAAIQAQVQQNVIRVMREQGKTTDEIVAQLTGKHVPALDKVVAAVREQEKATLKAIEAKKKAKIAEEEWQVAMAKAAREAENEYLKRQAKEAEELAEALKKSKQAVVDLMLAIADSTKPADEALKDFWKNEEQRASDYAKKVLERIEDEKKARQKHLQNLAQHFGGVSDILTRTGDLFVAMGMKADSALVKTINLFAGLADAAANVFANLASGNILGAISAGIGGIANAIGSLFGDKEHEQVNDMRDAFLELEGGFVSLGERLKVITDENLVQRVFDATTVQEFEAAVAEVNRMFDLQAQAEEKLIDAMERYGLTIDEMGPKWAQQELDKKAMQLFEDYELLIAAGADHNAVLAKMAPTMQEYVETAIKAGATIPESLRPMVEEMIRLGLLTDENGVAFESLEDAGINFAESLEQGLNRTIDAIKELVRVLQRLYGMGAPPAPPGSGDGGGDGEDHGGKGWKGGKGHAMGGWFPYRPGGYYPNIGEAGNEAVLNEPQIRKLVAEGVAMAGGSQPGGGRGGQAPIVQVFIGGDQIVPTLTRLKNGGYLN